MTPGALPARRRRRAHPLEPGRHRAGTALVAATQRGICMIELGDDPEALAARAARGIPEAALQRVDAGRDDFLAPRLQAVADALAGKRAQVPVDLIGTAFQKSVWDALMKIPRRRRPAAMPNSRAATRRARGGARGGQRLRAQPRRGAGALPSRDPRRRLAGRLSLGTAAETAVARSRTRRLTRRCHFFLRVGDCRVGNISPSLTVSNTSRVS